MEQQQHTPPPQLAQRLITWLLKEDLAEEVLGDLEEKYYQTGELKSWSRARRNYWYQVIQYLRPFAIKIFKSNNSIQHMMLRNYLKIAIRNARKNAAYSGLNIFGLTLGFSACMLILVWVHHESSVDRFHSNSDNIYRVWRNMYQSSGSVNTIGYIPQPVVGVLQSEYPEVEHVAAISWSLDELFEYKDVIGNELGMYASADFFSMLDYEVLAGSPDVLSNPSQIAISDRLARKYFGVYADDFSEVIGQTIILDEEDPFIVNAVFRAPDDKSSLEFDWLLSLNILIDQYDWMKSWDSGTIRLFVELTPNTRASVAARIEQEINDHVDEAVDERLILQPIAEQYLYSSFENGVASGGRITYVRILASAAIFLFVVVCLNAMNLITAQSGKRIMEVGVRKVLGESKASVRSQFLLESILFAVVGSLASLLLTWLVLPYFSVLIDVPLSFGDLGWQLWIYILMLIFLSGAFMGFYPSIVMPATRIIHSLKGKTSVIASAASYRKTLIVFQFCISVMIVFAASIIEQQVDFVLNKDLGVNVEKLLLIELEGGLGDNFEVYRNELLKIPEVTQVTGSSGNPISYGRSTGSAVWTGKDPNSNIEIDIINVNDQFVETMGIEILKGRALSADYGTDTSNYMVNEQAAAIMGFQDPIDKELSVWNIKGNIVGLFKDFHSTDVYQAIPPMIVRYDPTDMDVALIRLAGESQAGLLKIEELTRGMNPKYPFEFEFLERLHAERYRNEVVVGQLVKMFAIISVIVSCIGLFTLTTYATYLRTKEIGIRKVYGAGVRQIVLLITKEYTLLIAFSIILAFPLTLYYAQQWLDQFYYRIDISLVQLGLAGLAGLLIGVATVGLKSYQAATANPMDSLRNE